MAERESVSGKGRVMRAFLKQRVNWMAVAIAVAMVAASSPWTARGETAEDAAFHAACESLRWRVALAHEETLWTLPPIPEKLSRDASDRCRLALVEILLQARRDDLATPILDAITPPQEETNIKADPLFAARYALAVAQVASKARRGDDLDRALKLFDQAAHAHREPLPRRYRELAALLAHAAASARREATPLDTLTETLQRVVDHLSEGKTDRPVQEQQQQAMKSLDAIIDEIERQLQSADGSREGEPSGSGRRSARRPARVSQPFRLRAPGDVDHRSDIGDTSGWGTLPPKDREEALLRLERDFPTLYRQLIEAYFRETAEGRSE